MAPSGVVGATPMSGYSARGTDADQGPASASVGATRRLWSAELGWAAGAERAVGMGDLEGAVGSELDVPALGVDHVVVLGAQEHEVGH